MSQDPGEYGAAGARLLELYRKLDEFFARVIARYGEAMSCRAGCSDCCRRDFSVTAVEASFVRAALDALPPERRAEVAARAQSGRACAALDDEGRCLVYGSRPSICRTHGVAIRYAAPNRRPGRALPVVDACPKNFVGGVLEQLDPSCVLEQGTLSLLIGAIDAAYADELGRPRGERVELSRLFAGEPTGS